MKKIHRLQAVLKEEANIVFEQKDSGNRRLFVELSKDGPKTKTRLNLLERFFHSLVVFPVKVALVNNGITTIIVSPVIFILGFTLKKGFEVPFELGAYKQYKEHMKFFHHFSNEVIGNQLFAVYQDTVRNR